MRAGKPDLSGKGVEEGGGAEGGREGASCEQVEAVQE